MIAIIGAMELEVAELAAAMQQPQVTEKANMKFTSGLLDGVPAVAVRSGVGKVNAAVCTQILADCFGAGALVNTGIAGGVAPQVGIGDIVLSSSAQQHDMNVQLFGYAMGAIPQQECSDFPADPRLLEAARQSCAECLPDVRVHVGKIVSGDLFVSAAGQKAKLWERFGALCAEMEGAAIAHAAWLNHIPYLVVRTISDNADADAVKDYPAFEREAAVRSALLVRHMISKLG